MLHAIGTAASFRSTIEMPAQRPLITDFRLSFRKDKALRLKHSVAFPAFVLNQHVLFDFNRVLAFFNSIEFGTAPVKCTVFREAEPLLCLPGCDWQAS